MTSQATSQRLTVQEAAEVLGASVDAVRMRVRRGSLKSEKDSEGRVYVWVDTDASGTKPRLNGDSDALISEMRSRIQFLQDELQRKDAILLNMTEAMKAITPPAYEEASQEPPGAATAATVQSDIGQPRSGTEGAQEGTEPRSWWRRMFGN